MWTRLILRGFGALALAFILTSAAMFWLPYLERLIGNRYDTGWITTGYYDTYSPDYGGVYAERDLKKLSPADEREVLDEISIELKEKTNAELYQMRAFEDVCANNLVRCQGLASTKVKPFIDAILSDRQTTETALYSRAANFISAGSLFVSFVALIFTGLSYRRKRAAKSAP